MTLCLCETLKNKQNNVDNASKGQKSRTDKKMLINLQRDSTPNRSLNFAPQRSRRSLLKYVLAQTNHISMQPLQMGLRSLPLRHPEALLGRRMVQTLRHDELTPSSFHHCAADVQEVREEEGEAGWNDIENKSCSEGAE